MQASYDESTGNYIKTQSAILAEISLESKVRPPPKNVSFEDLDSLFISDLTFQNVQIFVSPKKFFLVSKKSKLCHIYSMFEKEC